MMSFAKEFNKRNPAKKDKTSKAATRRNESGSARRSGLSGIERHRPTAPVPNLSVSTPRRGCPRDGFSRSKLSRSAMYFVNTIYYTHRTPFDDGLSGHAKNRIAGKYRDSPAFQDMVVVLCCLLFSYEISFSVTMESLCQCLRELISQQYQYYRGAIILYGR